MLGAIIGDIVGSRFEWDNNRSKDFEFFTDKRYHHEIYLSDVRKVSEDKLKTVIRHPIKKR